jgi:hypothetical protein
MMFFLIGLGVGLAIAILLAALLLCWAAREE